MPCPFASASHMAVPQLEGWIPSPINLEAKMLTLAHWKSIHLLIDRLLFVQLSRILNIDTQIEKITTYLSASVLTDKVSGLSEQNSGGSLWSRHEDLEDCLLQKQAHCYPKMTAPLLASHNSHPGIHPTSLHSPPHQAGSRHSQWYDWRVYRHGYCNFCLLFQHK